MLSKVRGDTVPLLVSLAWLRISTTSCSGRTVHASQPCALVHLAYLSLFSCFVLAQNGVVLVHYKAKWHHLDVWFVKKAWANDVIFTISNKPYEPPFVQMRSLSSWGESATRTEDFMDSRRRRCHIPGSILPQFLVPHSFMLLFLYFLFFSPTTSWYHCFI